MIAPQTSPLDPGTDTIGENPLLDDPRFYLTTVGLKNNIAVCSRPDLSFATSHLARSMQTPKQAVLNDAKRCLFHMVHTREKQL